MCEWGGLKNYISTAGTVSSNKNVRYTRQKELGVEF